MATVARQLRPTNDPAAAIRCELVKCFGCRQVGTRFVSLARHWQPVPVDMPPGFEERPEPEPQALARLVPDGVRGEEVDVAEEDHAVPGKVCVQRTPERRGKRKKSGVDKAESALVWRVSGVGALVSEVNSGYPSPLKNT